LQLGWILSENRLAMAQYVPVNKLTISKH